MNLLDSINNPKDIKKLDVSQLEQLCKELRTFIIENLSTNPGHLGSSLGAVEIAVAVHYVYDTPEDLLVWDVGHQAYAHKILTGRKDVFASNRKLGGISGFPKREESVYDAFGGGHASVSISAALGMDVAAQLTGIKRKTVAVIGDGALSGGLAFEGMNNAGVTADNLLVILNDNDMSIDPNVGALKDYLLTITTSQRYNRLKKSLQRVLRKVPGMDLFVKKLWTGLKSSLLSKGNLFEALHFRYFGTVDGHDVKALVKVLTDIRDMKGPKLLHVVTVKGKGFAPAEENQIAWHAPGTFDLETGEILCEENIRCQKFQDVFGETLLELALQNPNIVGITPAMPSGCSMNIMQKVLPERVFDVGIAEGHAVTFAGGLATQGVLPYCNIYSSFMQRAIDNLIHDVVLQKVHAVFCLDRAGLVGEDGVTHHGLYDISMFRAIPEIILFSPMNEHELRNIMYTAQKKETGVFVIRYPRGRGVIEQWRNEFEEIEIGKARIIRQGEDVAFLSLGSLGNMAQPAIDRFVSETGKSVLHADLRFAKPIDQDLLHTICSKFDHIITLEDGVIAGGVGSAVLEFVADNGYRCSVTRLGVPDFFVEHGKTPQLMKICGYDAESVYQALKKSCGIR